MAIFVKLAIDTGVGAQLVRCLTAHAPVVR